MSVLPWIAAAAAILLCVAYWFRSRLNRAKSPLLDGIVLLLAKPLNLNAESLAMIVSRALDRPVVAESLDAGAAEDPNDDDAPAHDCVMGLGSNYAVFVQGALFMIHTASQPHGIPEDRYSARTVELRWKKAIDDHRAWLAIESFVSGGGEPNLQIVSRIAAELLGPETLALYHPPSGRILAVHSRIVESLRAALRSDDPVAEVFDNPELREMPVIGVEDVDPRLKAAEGEARRRFPEFVAAFREQDGKGDFAVKTQIESGGTIEHIWVDVKRIDDYAIHGVLGNEPVNLPGYSLGSPTEVPTDKIEDWCFRLSDSSEVAGRFTSLVLKQIAEKRSDS